MSLIGLVLATSSPPACATHSLTLGWESPPDSAGSLSYVVYYGTATGQYTHRLSIGSLRKVTISGLVEGVTYYFAVTTCDAIGRESLPSHEISYTVPGVYLTLTRAGGGAASAGQFQLASAGVVPFAWIVEESEDLKNWRAVSTGANSQVRLSFNIKAAPRVFFRLREGVVKSRSPRVALSIREIPSGTGVFQITSTDLVPFAWVLESSRDFTTWTPCFSGSNSVVDVAIQGGKRSSGFFRVRSE